MQIGFNNWQEDLFEIINLKTSVIFFFHIGHTLRNIMLLLKKKKEEGTEQQKPIHFRANHFLIINYILSEESAFRLDYR